jgi:hypothetical protein
MPLTTGRPAIIILTPTKRPLIFGVPFLVSEDQLFDVLPALNDLEHLMLNVAVKKICNFRSWTFLLN